MKLSCAFKKRVNHFRNELSVCGAGRADTVPLTQASLATRKRALSVRFMALAMVILSLLAIEDAFRAAPPATPEHDAAAGQRDERGHVEILPAAKQPNRESFRRETNVVARLPEFSR